LVENSSGNTVYSLAILGKLFGVPATKAVASHQISKGKLKLLQFFGVKPIINEEPICPDPSDPTSGIFKAKKWAEEQDELFNPGQYDNIDNPNIHAEITGQQIWKQTKGDIQMFCAGLGTTGTMVGTASFLKEQNPKIQTIGVVRSKNNPVPGPRTRNLLDEIAFDWQDVSDELIEVGTVESYSQSLKLCRHGLLVGPSTGFNLQGLFKILQQKKEDGTLNNLTNKEGVINAVVIACDTPFPYFDEYFYYLGKEEFPEIENEELLLIEDEQPDNLDSDLELSIDDFITQAYGVEREQIKNLNIEEIKKSKNVVILDIRSREMFEHFHVPYAIWTDTKTDIDTNTYNQKIFVVCQRGVSSLAFAQQLRDQDVEAYSVEGGTIEWSYHDLPREQAGVCIKKH
ncbi:pyridoxal-phosphate dependent enzyme, partial [Candidatus Saccharibacteria bacterium]|nr:pyridoxal-phosphate dependent enzyme [Candidatus Saccharibacteria bacterium]